MHIDTITCFVDRYTHLAASFPSSECAPTIQLHCPVPLLSILEAAMFRLGHVFAAVILCTPLTQVQQASVTRKPAEPSDAEVRFTDDSVVRMIVLQEYLEVTTRYGKLSIPIAEIQSIDFGVHWPQAPSKRSPWRSTNLAATTTKPVRRRSGTSSRWGPSAFPQLTAAVNCEDPETINER